MRKGETLPEELRNQFTKKTMPDAMPREQLRRAPNPRLVSDEDLIAILLLDADRRPICEPFLVSRGTTDGAIMHPREIFKHAIRWGANSIVVAHNHPCGNPTPSEDDVKLTRALLRAAEVMAVPLNDHIVIGDATGRRGRRYISIREMGLLDFGS